MKALDRFVKTKNDELEKSILHDIRLEAQIIKELESVFHYDLGAQRLEPQKEIVSFGALLRCCMCFESILLLIRNGYLGSAMALYRQVYELLVWAKLAIDIDDNEILTQIHDDFYNSGMNPKANNLRYYFKRINYDIMDDAIDLEMIRKEGRGIFVTYSYSTHGTSFAQQLPYKDDDFYQRVYATVVETAVWMECLVEVINAYLLKCAECANNTPRERSGELDFFFDIEFKRIAVINTLFADVRKQQVRIERIAPNIEDANIVKIFKHTKWNIKNKNEF